MNDVAELIGVLQDIELPADQLNALVTKITTDGLTSKVEREVRAVLMAAAQKNEKDLTRYEEALDIIKARDAELKKIAHETDQEIERSAMETNAALDTLNRKATEDVAAAKSGATLLLHSDDVSIGDSTGANQVPTSAPVNAPAEPLPAPIPSPTVEPTPAITPKEAMAAVMQHTSSAVPVSPTSSPTAPIMPDMPSNAPLPATMAPLPKTNPTPPAVTEPGA